MYMAIPIKKQFMSVVLVYECTVAVVNIESAMCITFSIPFHFIVLYHVLSAHMYMQVSNC